MDSVLLGPGHSKINIAGAEYIWIEVPSKCSAHLGTGLSTLEHFPIKYTDSN